MDIDLTDYIDEYIIELEEQLDSLNRGLLELEKSPGDQALINEVFRIAHTVKGSAATMGFEEITKVSHAFEDLLGEARDGTIMLETLHIELGFKAYDAITVLKDNLIADEKRFVDVDEIATEMKRVANPEEKAPARQPPAPAPPPESAPPSETGSPTAAVPSPGEGAAGAAGAGAPPASVAGGGHAGTEPAASSARDFQEPAASSARDFQEPTLPTLVIRMEFEPAMEMKSVRAFLVIKKLKEIGRILDSRPAVDDIEQNLIADFTCIDILLETRASAPDVQQILTFGNLSASNIFEGGRTLPPLEEMEGRGAAPPPPEEPAAVLPQTEVDAYDEASQLQELLTEPEPPAATPPGAATPRDEAPSGAAEGSEPQAPAERLLDQLNEDGKNLVVECINQDLNVFDVMVLFQDTSASSLTLSMTLFHRLAEMGRVLSSRPAKDGFHASTFQGVLQMLVATDKEVGQLRELTVAEGVVKASFKTVGLEGLNLVALEDTAKAAPQTGRGRFQRIGVAPSSMEERRGAVPTVRVTVDRLDHLMNLVGELVINKTQFMNTYGRYRDTQDEAQLQTGIHDLSQQLSRITADLQQGIMKVRMVQIGQVFFRFRRLVRDLSRLLGKQVELIIEGEETELDKTVIDEIGDPLMHLIRNAIDHGIEPPDVRRAKGKEECGFLLLKAQHVGDHILVETADDGAGLDLEKLKERALDNHLIDEATLRTLSPGEIYQFIFHPGFSTREEVSSISGRGVGMDVVKASIDKLYGDIQVKSEKDSGTTVIIKLPLTLAIIQGLLVKVAGETFSIPLSTVKETIQLDRKQVHLIHNQEVINFRDEVIPLVRLSSVFDLNGRHQPDKTFIVFAEDDDSRVGLVVDSLIARREIVIKSLDRRFTAVRGFAGATVLGDGTVSLILDVPTLIEDAKARMSA